MHGRLTAVLAGLIVSLLQTTGYFGIALLMALESACLPIPSELIMPFAGYLAGEGKLNLLLAATSGAVGCNLGSWLLYELGRRRGRAWVERWGRFVLLRPADLDRGERFFARFGGLAVFFGRMLPVVRGVIGLPAGIARMPRLSYQIYTFAGSWIWCFALAWVGERIGAAWRDDPRVRHLLHRADMVIASALLAAFAVFVARRLRDRRDSEPAS